MATYRVSEARAQIYRLVDEVAQTHQPILIEGKRSNAVLVAEEDWRAIEETLYLLSIPGMRASIRRGMNTPPEKCSTELKW